MLKFKRKFGLQRVKGLHDIHTVCLAFNFIKGVFVTDHSIFSNELKNMNTVDGSNTYE